MKFWKQLNAISVCYKEICPGELWGKPKTLGDDVAIPKRIQITAQEMAKKRHTWNIQQLPPSPPAPCHTPPAQHFKDLHSNNTHPKPLRFGILFHNTKTFFGCAWSIQKFPGPGSNPRHCSDPNRSSDNTGSLTHWATKDLPKTLGLNSTHLLTPMVSKLWQGNT